MARLGYGEEHLHEMVVSVARAVLRHVDDSVVTSLAYGGDLRPGGFTWTPFALARGIARIPVPSRRG
jgi:hypothetical protein